MKKKFIYLHGFSSSPNSVTSRALKRVYPQYDWIFPELNHHCTETIDQINRLIMEEQPDALIGTSLGGFYALYADSESGGRKLSKLVINPALYPSVNLRAALGENHYFNPRNDGVTDFTLTEADLSDFRDTELPPELLKESTEGVYCLYSTRDELLDNDEIDRYIFGNRAFATDLIGHRLEEDFIINELGKYLELL